MLAEKENPSLTQQTIHLLRNSLGLSENNRARRKVLKKNNFKIIEKHLEKANSVISPELFISEITNIAWKYNK